MRTFILKLSFLARAITSYILTLKFGLRQQGWVWSKYIHIVYSSDNRIGGFGPIAIIILLSVITFGENGQLLGAVVECFGALSHLIGR